MTDSHAAGEAGRFDDDLDALTELLDAGMLDVDAASRIARRSHGAAVPMSFAQELLWLLDRATPGMTAYNLPMARRLRGPLDVKALERALTTLVARHETLRTRFAEEQGEALQVVDAPSPLALRIVDLTSVASDAREAAAQRAVRERARTPFDLAHEHCFRPTLVVLGGDDHVLALESHHIVVDGWSMGVLFRELAATYAAERAGHTAVLPELPIQFGDYALWQREQLSGPRLAELLSFWRAQLGDATEPLALPTDFARPAVPSFTGARESITLDREMLSAVRRLAQTRDATLYMTLLAAYASVLHRYTGRENVLIGSGSAGRSLSETEGLVGYLNNMLVQRADFAGDPSFGELLGRVRESALGAYDHQDIPLEKLVLELRQGDARLSHAPLFEVVLTMQDAATSSLALGDVSLEPFGSDLGATKFDITLLVTEREQELVIVAQYRSDLFAPETIRRFLGHLRAVLAAAASDPDIRVSALPLLAEVERAQLAAWNETTVDEGSAATLATLFAAQVVRVGGRTAVVAGDATLTYAQLAARASALSGALRMHGVQANTPVGLLLDRSAEAIVGLLGIVGAGGAYVPLSVDAPAARIAQQLTESGATLVVTSSAQVDILPAGVTPVFVDAADDPSAVNVVGAPSDLAYVLFTSGSTGTPKGVTVTNANAVHYARAVSRVLADIPADVPGDGLAALDGLHFGLASTLAADLGNTSLLPALLSGSTLHVLPADVTTDPARFAEYAATHTLDVLKLTPNHLAALTAGKSGTELARVLPKRWIITGGEALRPELARTLLGANSCRVLNHYGPTETTVGVCTFEVTSTSLDALATHGAQTVPVGGPLANTHAYVVDGHAQEQPVGIPGELWIGGAGVTPGYLGRPEATAEKFVTFRGERVYRTGDRARRLPDGTIEFLGRADDQVKVRGYRVELGEIEQVLRGHVGVANAVVIFRKNDQADSRLVAFVVPNIGYATSHSDRPTPETMRAWVAAHLPAYMVPEAVVLLDAMPLTANGKVDRAQLPSIEAESSAGSASYIAPRTETEQKLADIWADVLGKNPVGITDDFLALGGHSLRAIRVLGKISKTFGVRLPLRTLFDAPTVEQLAVLIEKERPPAAQAPPPGGGITSRSRDAYRIVIPTTPGSDSEPGA